MLLVLEPQDRVLLEEHLAELEQLEAAELEVDLYHLIIIKGV
jgi:hypothetical protein